MSERRALLARISPLLLLVALAGAILLRADVGLELGSGDSAAAAEMVAALDAVPSGAQVLVGFDPDLGTYAEIRPTVRALLGDLLRRDVTLAMVSLTPEGRALAISELDRLRRAGAENARLVDLGFVPGAEAALVAVARALDAEGGEGVVTGLPDTADLGAVRTALVVGGNDIGPRPWVEQVLPRHPELTLLAVTPTILLPEVGPYRASGQLEALLTTPGEGAAYRATIQPGPLARTSETAGPPALAILVGLVVAIGVLGHGAGARLLEAARAARPREAP